MILRSITKHVKDQNWFAVLIDFLIVVMGILMAFQITNWSEQHTARTALEKAETALQNDLLNTYVFAKERLTLSDCRIAQISALGKTLLTSDNKWQGVPKADNNNEFRAIPIILRSPIRTWGSRIWQAELARGTFSIMDADRRN